jgi:cyclopropane fatty-acyl-phospholipid synthase-like methyltransferase
MTNYRAAAYERYKSFPALDYPQFAVSYRRRVSRYLTLDSNSRCLDLACGFGNFLAYLDANDVTHFIGVDSSLPATNVVSERFGHNRVVCADVRSFLRESKDEFDLVSALDFLEHLSKDELYEVLDLARQRLVPGGKLLVRVPNASGVFGMASRYNDITHETCFTPGSLRDVMSSSGLRPLAVWEDKGAPTSVIQLLHKMTWEIVRFGLRCIDAAETGMWGEGVMTRNMWALAEKVPGP